MSCIQNNPSGVTENLVFLNKVFYDNSGASCPVIYPLSTNSSDFTHRLIIGSGSCGCGCNSSFDLCNAVFKVTNSCVNVTAVNLGSKTTFGASDIMIDGMPVTSLTMQDGRYYADLGSIISALTPCPDDAVNKHICGMSNGCDDCNLQCENGGHFLLAEVPGPWELSFDIVLDGYVSNSHTSADFRLCIETSGSKGNAIPATVTGSSNFALYCVDIPCQSQGMAPALRFSFNACAMLLNPVITVTPPAAAPSAAGQCPQPPTVSLNASMVITPKINLQVVRPSLFALNATEVNTCCDNIGKCDTCAHAPSQISTQPSSCTPSQSQTKAPSVNTAAQTSSVGQYQCTEAHDYHY